MAKKPGKRSSSSSSAQLPLLFRAGEDLDESVRRLLQNRLKNLTNEPVQLVVTNNRHTMISSRRRAGVLNVRLHHMFLEADDATVRALGRYLTSTDRKAAAHLDTFIASNTHRIRKDAGRRPRLRTRGENHDLAEIFDELNAEWFGGKIDVLVTWGRRPPRRRRRSIRLGTYVLAEGLIRIHPVLDQPWVPRFFVAYVLFHEMLHHVVPAPLENGRQQFHSAEFRELERSYPDYRRAIAWEQANLRRLLSS